MEKTYLKLALIFLLSTIACCVTNDVNSQLVRFWNDRFIYTEKKGEANQSCSWEANKAYPSSSLSKDDWDGIYRKCMKKTVIKSTYIFWCSSCSSGRK